MREIEKEWQALQDAYKEEGKTAPAKSRKERYGDLVESVDRLLGKRLSKQDLRQLAASADMVPVLAKDQSRFENDMLAFLVKALVEQGDRESLVVLLSKRCPAQVEWPENIEYYLLFHGTHLHGSRLKDPILILGEAYSKCQVPETHRTLAAAVRRGFVDLGISGKDDTEFVTSAMQWCEKEKNHFVFNQDYFCNESRGPTVFTIYSYESHPEYYENPPQGFKREPLFKRSE